MRKPYWKKSHSCYYVQDPKTRREVRLDPDEEVAHDIWQQMRDARSTVGPNATYRRLAEEWLSEHYEDRPRFNWDARKIALFAEYVGQKLAKDVNKRDVVGWLTEQKYGQKRKSKDGEWVRGKPVKWGARTKKDAYEAISRVFRWAVTEGHLTKNPIRSVKLEPARPRNTVVSREQYLELLKAADESFRLLLITSALSGARPRQLREVEASNVSSDCRMWVFQDHKTRHQTNKPLVVYLAPCLQTLTRILIAKHKVGPLFRNANGEPWKKDTISQKFRRLREKVGLPAELTIYSLRHTFATTALVNGVAIAELAELMGHTDTRMVSRVYGHLDKHRDHLINAVGRATKRSD